MSVSRFYSLALGKFKNFSARTDGLIAQGDTTPDVALNSLLYANNSSNVVITDFDNGEEGQVLCLINVGSNLSFLKGTEFKYSYGERSTTDYFLHYGFVPKSNFFDCINIAVFNSYVAKVLKLSQI